MPEHSIPYGYELQFRLKFVELDGDGFQDFFADVMERRDAGFRRVRPWGNHGDRKNDGWSPARRILFQAYAPSTFSSSKLADKLQEDYEGAIDYWEEYFDTWVFVHNDIKGLGPEVTQRIAALNGSDPNEVECVSWGREQVRREVAQLSSADLTAVLGPPISNRDFLDVSAESIAPLFQHLQLDLPSEPDAGTVGKVPVDKIQRNNLGDAVGRLLVLGETKMSLVDEFLTRTSSEPTYKADIAATFTNRYLALKEAGYGPDEIFNELLAWITGGQASAQNLVDAVTVLGYFFFTCQIFEEFGS